MSGETVTVLVAIPFGGKLRGEFGVEKLAWKSSRDSVSSYCVLAPLLEEAGLSPDVIERIYRELVSYFIDEEQKHRAGG